jgi:hypothetical protein
MLPIMARNKISHAWLHYEKSKSQETQQPRGLAGKIGPNSAGRSAKNRGGFLTFPGGLDLLLSQSLERRRDQTLEGLRARVIESARIG